MKRKHGLLPGLVVLALLIFCPGLFAGNYEAIGFSYVRGKVFWKLPGNPPFEVSQGMVPLRPGLSILSFFNGQCFFNSFDGSEIRLKEDSVVVLQDEDMLELRKGIMGVRGAKAHLKISTPHANLLLASGTIVIKSNSILTRISVVKGGVFLLNEKQNSKVLITAGQEVAAGGGMFSKIYPQTDELRYSWYWVGPAQEPSLMLE